MSLRARQDHISSDSKPSALSAPSEGFLSWRQLWQREGRLLCLGLISTPSDSHIQAGKCLSERPGSLLLWSLQEEGRKSRLALRQRPQERCVHLSKANPRRKELAPFATISYLLQKVTLRSLFFVQYFNTLNAITSLLIYLSLQACV